MSLSVRSTTLPGCDFMGLFAERAFVQGELVCVYSGVVLRTKEAVALDDKSYLMRLGEQCYVDAREDTSILARYINDCIASDGWNVRFDKRPEEQCAHVLALRDIAAGEELFADYGRWYWLKKSPAKLSRRRTNPPSTN